MMEEYAPYTKGIFAKKSVKQKEEIYEEKAVELFAFFFALHLVLSWIGSGFHGSSSWERFFKEKTNTFFKDRHYLDQEFPEIISTSGGNYMEFGCGAGNTMFPILELNTSFDKVYAFDCSTTAVEIVKKNPQFDPSRMVAFVHDLAKPAIDEAEEDNLSSLVPDACVDLGSLVFVLSALSPETMTLAVRKIARKMKSGGILYFRDYASGDLAQKRFEKSGRTLSDSFAVRGDGTRAYFFPPEELQSLFEAHGFETISLKVDDKKVVNRKQQVEMNRRWIQARFRRK